MSCSAGGGDAADDPLDSPANGAPRVQAPAQPAAPSATPTTPSTGTSNVNTPATATGDNSAEVADNGAGDESGFNAEANPDDVTPPPAAGGDDDDLGDDDDDQGDDDDGQDDNDDDDDQDDDDDDDDQDDDDQDDDDNAAPAPPNPAPPAPVAGITFTDDVYPILVSNCARCHAAGGLPNLASANVDTAFNTAVRESGEIVSLIADGEMPADTCSGPPGSNGCVSVASFNVIREWVAAGRPR
jgi:hypothetical protein